MALGGGLSSLTSREGHAGTPLHTQRWTRRGVRALCQPHLLPHLHPYPSPYRTWPTQLSLGHFRCTGILGRGVVFLPLTVIIGIQEHVVHFRDPGGLELFNLADTLALLALRMLRDCKGLEPLGGTPRREPLGAKGHWGRVNKGGDPGRVGTSAPPEPQSKD